MQANNYSTTSQIKLVGLEMLRIIDTLAQPRLKNGAIRKFWNWFFVSHGRNAVLSMSDEELKQVMRSGYLALKPIYEKADMGHQLNEGLKMGSPAPPKVGDLKEIMDLYG